MPVSSKLNRELVEKILTSQTKDHYTGIRSNSSPEVFLDKLEFYDKGTKIFVTSGLNPAVFTTNAVTGIRVWSGSAFDNAVPSVTLPTQSVVRSFYDATTDTMFLVDITPVNKTNRFYRGKAPCPYTVLTKGDVWEELDVSNDWIEDWIWNGSVWVSKKEIFFSYNSNVITLNTTLTGTHFANTIDSNILVSKLVVSGMFNTVQTATNFWQIAISHLRSPALLTSIQIVFSYDLGVTAGSEFKVSVPINQVLSSTLGITKFRIAESRPQGNSTKNLSYTLICKKVRI